MKITIKKSDMDVILYLIRVLIIILINTQFCQKGLYIWVCTHLLVDSVLQR